MLFFGHLEVYVAAFTIFIYHQINCSHPGIEASDPCSGAITGSIRGVLAFAGIELIFDLYFHNLMA